MKDFSFIIPCYNLAHYLPFAVEAALGQTYGDNEVIVVNDGSTDATPEVAESYGDKIRYIYKPNAGLSAARNTGILEANGRFLLFLDADDTIDSNFVEAILEQEKEHPDASVFVTGYRSIDEKGNWLWDDRGCPIGEDVFHQLMGRNLAPPLAFAVKRAALANTGLFDVTLKSCEDWELWLRLAAAGFGFRRIDTILVSYRQVTGSMSKNGVRMWQTTRQTLHKAVRFAKHDDCGRCRAQSRVAEVNCLCGFVLPSLWGRREDKQARNWRQRLFLLLPILAKNPSMIPAYILSRYQRVREKLAPTAQN